MAQRKKDSTIWDMNSYVTLEGARESIDNKRFHELPEEKQIELLDDIMDSVHNMAFGYIAEDLNYLIDDEMGLED